MSEDPKEKLNTQEIDPNMVNTFSDGMSLEQLNLDWSDTELLNSLDLVYDYTVYKANSSIGWYDRDAKRKKRWARTLRLTAIGFAALGAVFPVLIPILNDWGVDIGSTWATIVLAIAGGAVATDRLFGFSSSWMRSITTGMRLRGMLDSFQFAWESERVMLGGEVPTNEQAQALIARCGEFVDAVGAVVQEETAVWVQEFSNSLAQLDQRIAGERDTQRVAALVVNVVNGDQTDDGWLLTVQGKRTQQYRGVSGVMNGLFPGLYRVRVEATIDGKSVASETAVTITAGEIAHITLTLGQ